jgi:HD-like signal output (HDOD) protein
VLRIANSSYYGLKTRVVALEHAASVLGLGALRNIVLQTAVFEALNHLRGEAGLELRQLWKHSVASAQLCETFARLLHNPDLPTPEEVYVVGLLHDIGRFALLDAATFSYARVVAESKSSGRPLVQVERERLGITHLGACPRTRSRRSSATTSRSTCSPATRCSRSCRSRTR